MRALKDLPGAIERWEEQLRFLAEYAAMEMDPEDKKFNVLMLAPADLRKKVLEQDYNKAKYPDYITLKQHLLTYVVREADEKTKGLHHTGPRDGEGNGEGANPRGG